MAMTPETRLFFARPHVRAFVETLRVEFPELRFAMTPLGLLKCFLESGRYVCRNTEDLTAKQALAVLRSGGHEDFGNTYAVLLHEGRALVEEPAHDKTSGTGSVDASTREGEEGRQGVGVRSEDASTTSAEPRPVCALCPQELTAREFFAFTGGKPVRVCGDCCGVTEKFGDHLGDGDRLETIEEVEPAGWSAWSTSTEEGP